MTVYIFDNTFDGLLTAVFDSFFRKQQNVVLLVDGEQLPLFAEAPHRIVTDSEKAERVWKGLEKYLSKDGLHMIAISWLSEERALNQPLFNFICKVFRMKLKGLERNASDEDVLVVRNTCRRVLHEQLRMKQFIRFQKAKDGTYLAVVSPDHNVLPLIIDHFQDRFNDQPWLIYDAHRHYGYYYDGTAIPIRITFEDESAVPFSLENGKLDTDVLSENDQIFQNLWRSYFKAICIKERMNPKKQLSDMPRRYWKYMTEKNG
jgi:probable DNA metabolism protein